MNISTLYLIIVLFHSAIAAASNRIGKGSHDEFSSNNATHIEDECRSYEVPLTKRRHNPTFRFTAYIGQCLQLNCLTSRKSTMTWIYNNQTIAKKDFLTTKGYLVHYSLPLKFEPVTSSNSGLYVCRARRGNGRIEQRAVDLDAKPPIEQTDTNCQLEALEMRYSFQQQQTKRVTVYTGGCVRIHCAAMIDNIQSVVWVDKSHAKQKDLKIYQLDKITPDDAGYIKCMATLRNGKTFSRDAQIIVRPTPVGGQEETCGPYQFRCTSGECIFQQYHCDNRRNCADNSDEEKCGDCRKMGQFLCRNGRCIAKDLVCDRFHNNDCGDMSDETCMLPNYPHVNVIPPSPTPAVTQPAPVVTVHNVPWLNTTVHCVIGITVGIVIFTAAAVIFIYRHKMRMTRDIRRRIATVRRVRCAVQNDYQPPPVRITELDPFLEDNVNITDYDVTDYNFHEGGNIFLNVNSVHYIPGPRPPFLPSYSDVEDTRSTEPPPPPYDEQNQQHERQRSRGSSSSDYEFLNGNPWRRRVVRRESHDYVNVGQQVCPHDFPTSQYNNDPDDIHDNIDMDENLIVGNMDDDDLNNSRSNDDHSDHNFVCIHNKKHKTCPHLKSQLTNTNQHPLSTDSEHAIKTEHQLTTDEKPLSTENTQPCQCKSKSTHKNDDLTTDIKPKHVHDYVNVAKTLQRRSFPIDCPSHYKNITTCVSCGHHDSANFDGSHVDLGAISSSGSNSSTDSSEFSQIANCSCGSAGFALANSYTDFPCEASCAEKHYFDEHNHDNLDNVNTENDDNFTYVEFQSPNFPRNLQPPSLDEISDPFLPPNLLASNACNITNLLATNADNISMDSITSNVDSESSINTISTQTPTNEDSLINNIPIHVESNFNLHAKDLQKPTQGGDENYVRDNDSQNAPQNLPENIQNILQNAPQNQLQNTTKQSQNPPQKSAKQTKNPSNEHKCKTCASFTRHNPQRPKSATYPITNLPKARYSSAAPYRRPEPVVKKHKSTFNRNLLKPKSGLHSDFNALFNTGNTGFTKETVVLQNLQLNKSKPKSSKSSSKTKSSTKSSKNQNARQSGMNVNITPCICKICNNVKDVNARKFDKPRADKIDGVESRKNDSNGAKNRSVKNRQVNLNGANFEGANLERANLEEADLGGADFGAKHVIDLDKSDTNVAIRQNTSVTNISSSIQQTNNTPNEPVASMRPTDNVISTANKNSENLCDSKILAKAEQTTKCGKCHKKNYCEDEQKLVDKNCENYQKQQKRANAKSANSSTKTYGKDLSKEQYFEVSIIENMCNEFRSNESKDRTSQHKCTEHTCFVDTWKTHVDNCPNQTKACMENAHGSNKIHASESNQCIDDVFFEETKQSHASASNLLTRDKCMNNVCFSHDSQNHASDTSQCTNHASLSDSCKNNASNANPCIYDTCLSSAHECSVKNNAQQYDACLSDKCRTDISEAIIKRTGNNASTSNHASSNHASISNTCMPNASRSNNALVSNHATISNQLSACECMKIHDSNDRKPVKPQQNVNKKRKLSVDLPYKETIV